MHYAAQPEGLSELLLSSLCVSPDAADGHQAFLRLVCDALRGRGLISADHNGRAHCVQAGDPEGQRATLQILAAYEPGAELTHVYPACHSKAL